MSEHGDVPEVVGDVILVEGAVRREDEVYLSRRRVHQLPILQIKKNNKLAHKGNNYY